MKLYENYLLEKEIKIHPKRKTASSFLAVAPIDDVVAAGGYNKNSKR